MKRPRTIEIIGIMVAVATCIAGWLALPQVQRFIDRLIVLPQASKNPTKLQNPNLIHNEPVSPETLAKIVGGDVSYWAQRGSVVWGYSNKNHNTVFHHPGDNMILTYWAGFGDPQNADDCQIIVPLNDNLTKYVKCPSGTKAEIIADQVGLHLEDYTGYFP